jgi:hypothetical protein
MVDLDKKGRHCLKDFMYSRPGISVLITGDIISMNKHLRPEIVMAFLTGYFISNVIGGTGMSFISQANAKLSDMSYYDLQDNYDFKNAVMSIVEKNCRTDIRPSDFKTWHYCGDNSRFSPSAAPD